MPSSLPPFEVVRLSKNLLVRGVHQFVRENVSLVAVILLLTGIMSRFDPFELVCLLGWMIIGIASSIGFGVGIPTRVLFVWPYILRTSQATSEDLVSAWIQVLPVAVIHALGSALGELPPFLGASLLVRRLNLDHEKTAMAISHRWFVQRMQNGWGWMWVCVLGAWPNVAFDMAGLAAGASGMSLPSFLSAAVVGKAVVRAPIAAGLVVASSHSVSWLPDWTTSWVQARGSDWSPLLSGCWTLFVVAVSSVCMWWCLREAAEEELRRNRR